MSNDTARFATDLWEAIREYLPPKKGDAALAFLQVFADHGHDSADLTDVQDDDDLAGAYAEVFGEEHEIEADWDDE